MNRRKWLFLAVFCGLVCLFWTTRFHPLVFEVEPGVVYGSSQLPVEDLRDVIGRFGIRTVVNLRGHGGNDTWYDDETVLCSELGVEHVTISFPLDDWPPRYRLIELLEVLDGANRAILMHCRRGVDRTGWASAVADLAAGRPIGDAQRRLSWRRGHFCRRSRCPQHRFVSNYVRDIEARGESHSAEAFRRWVSGSYCPPAYDVDLQWLSGVPAAVAGDSQVEVRFHATNRGAETWRMSRSKTSGVRMGLRLLGPYVDPPEPTSAQFLDRGSSPVDVARSGFDEALVDPGGWRDFSLTFTAPSKPGIYLVQADLVDEGVHWFCEMGRPGIVWILRVETV